MQTMYPPKACRDSHCSCRQDVPHNCPNLVKVSQQPWVAANNNWHDQWKQQEQQAS